MDITIEGFKSLKKVRLNDLTRVNYLIGENASGKSSVLECLQVFNAALNTNVRSGSFNIVGLNKHAFNNSGFKFSINRPSGRVIKMQVPVDSDIQNGQVNHGANEIITIDDEPLWRYHDGDSRREALRRVEALSFTTAYVSAIQELESGYYIRPTFMDFNFGDIDITSSDHLITFLNNYYPHIGKQRINSIIKTMRSDNAIMLQLVEKAEHGGRVIYFEDSEEHVPIASLSGGLRSMIRLYYGIEGQLRNIPTKENIMRIICIEEPEIGFHPKLQKELPGILQDFVNRYSDVTFFVTTHSPFVASAASGFEESQRLYLFDKGSLVDLNQDHVDESSGYKGGLCLNVIAQMLGAGFGDMGVMPRTSEQFTVVYCEGASKDLRDSILYKRIFADKNIIFISCADLVNAVYAFRLGLEGARFMLGKETRVMALVDRSYGCRVKRCDKQGVEPHSHDLVLSKHTTIEKTHPNKPLFTDDERQKIMATDSENRIQVLLRKEIENYLFDPAVVAFLTKSEQKLLEIPDDLDVINGEVKDRIKFTGDKIKIMHRLAEIIYEKREDPKVKPLYQELEGYIIG
ncbi:MAG TPA: AAA family ATPase [Candidatus Saccharimonadales bacterium]|nr:AAA family ATPase [Candidatus Saccharimonadales bacterium]